MSNFQTSDAERELAGLHASSEADAPMPDAHAGATTVDRFVERLGNLCAWLVLIAMVISVYEVICRYVFDAPTSWVHETTTFLVASIFALGGPYTLARNRHIQITVLYDLLSPGKRRWLQLLVLILSLGFCVAVGYASWVIAYQATHAPGGGWHMQTSGSAWDSPLPAYTKIVILLAVLLMAVQLLVRFGAFVRRKR